MVLAIAPWYRTFCYLQLKPVIWTTYGASGRCHLPYSCSNNRYIDVTSNSSFGPVNWPPRSCDITPLDFFLWGYVKSEVMLANQLRFRFWKPTLRVSLTPYRSKCSNESSKIGPSEWTPWCEVAASIWMKLYSKNKWHKMSFRMKNKDSTLDLNFCIFFYFEKIPLDWSPDIEFFGSDEILLYPIGSDQIYWILPGYSENPIFG